MKKSTIYVILAIVACVLFVMLYNYSLSENTRIAKENLDRTIEASERFDRYFG